MNFVNRKQVRRRVSQLRRDNPDLTNRELCDLIIKQKCLKCAAAGTVTALPAAVPGLGTVLALLGGTFLDISAISYFMSEMILEMAVVYERDPSMSRVSKEAVWVFASAVGSNKFGRNISQASMRTMNNQVMVKMLQDIFRSLGIRATQRSVVRIIPLLGAGICGGVNYLVCRKVGRMAADYYESNQEHKWKGVTIDV
jgi:hypothetical protein